jgi:hypothetical protein
MYLQGATILLRRLAAALADIAVALADQALKLAREFWSVRQRCCTSAPVFAIWPRILFSNFRYQFGRVMLSVKRIFLPAQSMFSIGFRHALARFLGVLPSAFNWLVVFASRLLSLGDRLPRDWLAFLVLRNIRIAFSLPIRGLPWLELSFWAGGIVPQLVSCWLELSGKRRNQFATSARARDFGQCIDFGVFLFFPTPHQFSFSQSHRSYPHMNSISPSYHISGVAARSK